MPKNTDTETKSPEREAAELAKLGAETAKIHLENQAAEIDLRKAIAEANQAQNEAIVSGIIRVERERIEELTKVQDHYVFHHYFDGPVNIKSVYGALNTLNAWDRLYPESPWTIHINSPGGDAVAGMQLFDTITRYSSRGGGSHEITMIVEGYAASMAGILLQAADVRKVGAQSYLMIHEISAGTGGKIGDIKDDVKWYQMMCDRIAALFVSRSGGLISLEDFKKGWERHDWWLDSDESLRLGFVDAID